MNKLDSSKNCAIGIDIGGTKIAMAVIDASGKILARQTMPTDSKSGFANATTRLNRVITQLMQEIGDAKKICGIGIGCAGPVDPIGGTINNPHTLAGWEGAAIVDVLHERWNIPVRLENDADAAALGEGWIGAARGVNCVVMLTFGTGVGGGVLQRGEIYRSLGGTHPELGAIVVDPTGPACYCGTRGCLESLASGTAIDEAGRSAGYADARAVFSAAKLGELEASRIIDRAVNATATAIWSLSHLICPDLFLLGGGIMEQHFACFHDVCAQRLEKATQFPVGKPRIKKATLGNDAGLFGAARLVLSV